MSDPTTLAYGTQDISSSSTGDCEHCLEDNLKFVKRVVIGLASAMLNLSNTLRT